MSHYKSNLRDIEFNLFEALGRQELLGTGPFAEVDTDTARDMLAEINRLAMGPVAESFTDADRNPPVFDPATGTVTLPESFRRSFRALMDGEWWRLSVPPELGGTVAPRSLAWAVAEFILGANPAAWMYTNGPTFATVLWKIGTPEQKRFAEQAVEREWGSTMVLTEPDAGSDVGAGRTKAIEQPDGTWHIEGVKRFITGAEHDMAENIFHLVLARPEGAAGGTKGLSMFLVPKYLVHEDGSPGERNGVKVTNLEHKMGLKVSTTCELTFGGDPDRPAIGTLVGGVHDGIRQMFLIIEHARMMVGSKAIETLSTGYLNALDFARNRVQGPDQAAGQGLTAGDDHQPPGRAPDADAAEGLRGGPARAHAVHGYPAGRGPARRGERHGRRGRGRAQRPAAAPGQGRRVRAGLRDAHAVPADARRVRLPAGLPDRAVHQGLEDRQPLRGHHRHPEPGLLLPQDGPRPGRDRTVPARRGRRVRGGRQRQRAPEDRAGRPRRGRLADGGHADGHDRLRGRLAGPAGRGLQGRAQLGAAAARLRRPDHRLAASPPRGGGAARAGQRGHAQRSRPRLLHGQDRRGPVLRHDRAAPPGGRAQDPRADHPRPDGRSGGRLLGRYT